jgi:hypothetical protein
MHLGGALSSRSLPDPAATHTAYLYICIGYTHAATHTYHISHTHAPPHHPPTRGFPSGLLSSIWIGVSLSPIEHASYVLTKYGPLRKVP